MTHSSLKIGVASLCLLGVAACASTSGEDGTVRTDVPASSMTLQQDDFPDGPAPSPARAKCYESCGRPSHANYDLWLRCCVRCDDTVALDPIDPSPNPPPVVQ